MPRRVRCVVLVRLLIRILVGGLVVVLVSGTAPAAGGVRYAPPVDAPVLDPFRMADGPYGPGNRGLEYDVRAGDVVRAIGDGVVAFAGPVAGRLVVSVEHPDGLRSSLTGLTPVGVALGAPIARGQQVGTAAVGLHLGVRRDGAYLDPASLCQRAPGRASLVPEQPWAGQPDERLVRRLTTLRCPPACKATLQDQAR